MYYVQAVCVTSGTFTRNIKSDPIPFTLLPTSPIAFTGGALQWCVFSEQLIIMGALGRVLALGQYLQCTYFLVISLRICAHKRRFPWPV